MECAKGHRRGRDKETGQSWRKGKTEAWAKLGTPITFIREMVNKLRRRVKEGETILEDRVKRAEKSRKEEKIWENGW